MSIKKLLTDDEYVMLHRLIMLHKKLFADGLEDDEYEEYEDLRQLLQNVVP